MKIYSLLAFLILSLNISAQTLHEKELIGKWYVVKVEAAPQYELDQAELEKIKNIFMKAKFDFREDKSFTMEMPVKELELDNGYWLIKKGSNQIIIQEEKGVTSEESAHLIIMVRKKEDKVFFLLDETPIILEVKKE